ncbi:hypothetical protein C8R43DRAFT_1154565 [Mycena crocata]|nr:hypothetical protein C8R43DRAFT_1154565 [Mycena crocata]
MARTAHSRQLVYRPLNVLRTLRRIRLAAIRSLPDPMEQALALLALGDPYDNDGPGELYLKVRVASGFLPQFLASPFVPQFIAGTLPTHILQTPDVFQVKVGHTDCISRRRSQYYVCDKDHHPIYWHGYCSVPKRKLAERLVHLSLIALGARVARYPCPGCTKRHREFFSLAAAGGLQSVEEVVKFWVEALGGVYHLSNPQGMEIKEPSWSASSAPSAQGITTDRGSELRPPLRPVRVAYDKRRWRGGRSTVSKGSAVYIFGIDQENSQPDIVFTLGSTRATHHYTGTERFAYNALFFSATGLAADQTHTVNWIHNINPSSGVGVQAALFDYVIVTSGTEDVVQKEPGTTTEHGTTTTTAKAQTTEQKCAIFSSLLACLPIFCLQTILNTNYHLNPIIFDGRKYLAGGESSSRALQASKYPLPILTSRTDYRIPLAVIAAHPPPPTTSTAPQPLNHLRNVSFRLLRAFQVFFGVGIFKIAPTVSPVFDCLDYQYCALVLGLGFVGQLSVLLRRSFFIVDIPRKYASEHNRSSSILPLAPRTPVTLHFRVLIGAQIIQFSLTYRELGRSSAAPAPAL